MADYNSNGQLVLHSSSLVFQTRLSQPSKAREPDETQQRSLWSLRRRLKSDGWNQVTGGRHASVQDMAFNGNNTSSVYLAILIERDPSDIG